MKDVPRLLTLLLTIFLSSQSVFGQGLPTAQPEDVGMSSDRLDRIEPVIQSYIDREKLAGVVTLVARHEKVVHFEKYGMQDESQPMQLNTIFRIASMTKPVTSVAIMMLYEEGAFLLDDPVAKYIPEFKDVQVYSKTENGKPVLVKPKKRMTIKDLLTHTSGLTYGIFGKTPVDTMYLKANLHKGNLKEMVNKLSKIPLLHQPGDKWQYSLSTDVLGYIVEVISGKPLNEFFEERIFEPLGMKDTGFYVPEDKADRLSARYGVSKERKLIIKKELRRTGELPKLLSGGGGLVSTASDYLRFSQMLLNKGELEGKRILGSRTVEFMTENHLPAHIMEKRKTGFGLGFSVLVNVPQTHSLGSIGEFRWSGIYNTHFWIAPKDELIFILMSQFSPKRLYKINEKFKVLVYQAIVD